MSVTIVIPVFNLWEQTSACLQSLADCSRGAVFRVVVADNGSTDETASACAVLGQTLFPGRFEHRRLGRNLGFARGCNAGAAGAATPFVLFLNNDTTATPGWLEVLLRVMQDNERVHAVSPLLLYPSSHRVQHAGVAYDPNLKAVHCFHQFPGNHPAIRTLQNVRALSAAALLVRRHAFEAVGGFWAEYLNGCEDMDLSCMLQRNGGRLALEWGSVLHHATSMTPGRHDHAVHNATVLNKRARGFFTPDLHRHAARAGYELGLTEWLEPYLVPHHHAVQPRVDNDPTALAAALTAEPLWDLGYELLLAHLAHDPARALPWAEARAELCPGRDALEQALRCAEAAEDQDAVARCKERLARAMAALGNAARMVDLARSSLAWCRREGQEGLAALYETWLQARARA